MLKTDHLMSNRSSVRFDQDTMRAFLPGMICQLVTMIDGDVTARFPVNDAGPYLVMDSELGSNTYQSRRIGRIDPALTEKITVWHGDNHYFTTDQIGSNIESYVPGEDIFVNTEGYLVPGDARGRAKLNIFNAGRCIAVDREQSKIKVRLHDNQTQVNDMFQMSNGIPGQPYLTYYGSVQVSQVGSL